MFVGRAWASTPYPWGAAPAPLQPSTLRIMQTLTPAGCSGAATEHFMRFDKTCSPQAGGGRMGRLGPLLAASVLGLAACSPALDWRQTAPPVAGLHSLLPCRPERAERSVPLAGSTVQLQMASCEAAGALWAIASADVQDSARTAAALQALNDALLLNLGTPAVRRTPWALAGSSLPAERLEAEGHRPDGLAVQLSLLAFAQGTRIYRASVLRPTADSSPLPEEALSTFVEGLRLQAP